MKSPPVFSRNILFTFMVISVIQYASAQVPWPLSPVNAMHRIWEGYGNYAGNTIHFHEGLDLPVDSGSPVLAVTAGRILERNTVPASHYNQLISISNSLADTAHGFGYVHIRFNEFKNDRTRFWQYGDTTAVGDTIGFVAIAAGILSHLHFEKINNQGGISPVSAFAPDLDGNPIDTLSPVADSEIPTIVTPVRYSLHGGAFYTESTASGDTVIRNNVDIFANMYDRFSNFAGVTNYNIAVKKAEFGVSAYSPGYGSQITFPQIQIEFAGHFLSNDTPNTGRNTFGKFRTTNKAHAVYSNTGICASAFPILDGTANNAVYWHRLTNIDTVNNTFQETDQNYFWDTNGKAGGNWNDMIESVDHEADSNKTAAFPDGRYIVKIKCYGYGGASDTTSINDTVFVNNFNEYIYSCDLAGKELDYFCIGDPVYIKGRGFPKNTSFKVHLIKDTTWITGMVFNLPGRVATITLTSDTNGNIPPTALWASYMPNDSPDKGYDMIIDYEGDSFYTSAKETFVVDPQDISISGMKAITGINPFQKTYGDTLDESAFAVYPTSDGGFIFAGATTSFGASMNDAYLVKTDIRGDTLWTKTFSGIAADNIFSVQQTPDSGYVLTGHNKADRSGTVDDDVYLIRTSKTGDLIWIKNIGTIRTEKGFEVKPTSDGGYIITGHARNPAGEDHAYLIKTDAAGTVVWTKIYNSGLGRVDLAYAVQQTDDGGYIIAGYTAPASGPADAFLIKTDPAGAVAWIKLFGGAGIDHAVSVQQLTDGGYVLAGSSNSFGSGDFDVFIVRTDSSGTVMWTKVCGGLSDDFSYSVRQTSDLGFIIAGKTSSFGAGGTDVYAIKLDASGVLVWSRAYGGVADDAGNASSQAKDGGYVIAGTTFSFGAGGSDSYLIKTDCMGSSGCHESASATVSNWCTGALALPPVWSVTSAGTPISPAPVIGSGGSTITIICDCIIPEQPDSITGTGGIAKVCPGDTRTYTVPPVTHAASYTWSVPAGASITSGAGTNTVTIMYSLGFTASGTLEVVAVNSCGSSPASSIFIEMNTPEQPGSVTGPASAVCPGTTKNYSVPSVPGVTYNWTAPANASIISGQGSNSVTVTFGGSFTSGTLSVTAVNGCGSSMTRTRTIKSVPTKPGTISGPSAAVCPGTTKTYSVPFVSGVTWTWTAPFNASIAGGQGTNSVTVNYNISFASGTIAVIAANACGSSNARTLSVKSIPSIPGVISGPASEVCAGTTKTYSIPFVGGVTWAWNPPAGASIAGGQGSNTVNIDFSPSFLSGAVSVTAVNACGSSSARTLSIQSVPATPGAISGPSTAVCAGTTQTYSVPFVSGLSWTWTPPPNAGISGGQGTNSVTVDFNNSFVSGSLKVVAVNSCGNSVLKSLSVKSKPDFPGTIAGNTSPCEGSVQTYSIAAVPGAVSCLWTVPAGSTITSGQGTTTVTVSVGSVSGNIKVKGVNACGNGTAKSLALSVTVCTRSETNNRGPSADLKIFPNPASEELVLEYRTSRTEEFKLQLLDLSGRVILRYYSKATKGVNRMKYDVSMFAKGVYILQLISSSKTAEQRIIIQ